MSDILNIRLKIEGRLLEVLKEEASKEFRSPTQHVMYLITKHFEDRLSVENSTDSVYNSFKVTEDNQKALKVTESNYNTPENTFSADEDYIANFNNTDDDLGNVSYDDDLYDISNEDNSDYNSYDDFNDSDTDINASIDDDIANF